MKEEFGDRRNGAKPLSCLKTGSRALVAKIDAGCGLTARLSALGLLPGAMVEVIAANGGPLVISVLGSRVMLGQGMAAKVLVREPRSGAR